MSSVMPERTAGGKAGVNTKGILALIVCSVLILGLFLPFFSWIEMVNTEALFGVMKLTKSVVEKVTDHYLFHFLSFVQVTKQGILGLWSCILLLLSITSIYFQLGGIVTYLRRNRIAEGKGMLRTFSRFQVGMLFSLVTALGTIGLMIFANLHYEMVGFLPGIPVYAVLVLALCAYLISKRMEKRNAFCTVNTASLKSSAATGCCSCS